VLNGVGTYVGVACDRESGIGMVIAEEGFELDGHLHDSHDGEVVLIVPAPGDLPV
jgi:hypothetical protein